MVSKAAWGDKLVLLPLFGKKHMIFFLNMMVFLKDIAPVLVGVSYSRYRPADFLLS